MKYNVTITEILEKTIEIEAENETNAIDIARDKYNKEEVILTADDLADTWFSLYEQQGEREYLSFYYLQSYHNKYKIKKKTKKGE